MKKRMTILLLLLMTPSAFAYDTGHTEDGVFRRIAKIEGRAVLNLLGMPAELVRTPVEEARIHPRIWPLTMLPRTVTNIFIRSVSAVYDLVLTPFVQPFTDDTSPLTDAMGLPVYPWQISESRY